MDGLEPRLCALGHAAVVHAVGDDEVEVPGLKFGIPDEVLHQGRDLKFEQRTDDADPFSLVVPVFLVHLLGNAEPFLVQLLGDIQTVAGCCKVKDHCSPPLSVLNALHEL